jgi:hypothetical protein
VIEMRESLIGQIDTNIIGKMTLGKEIEMIGSKGR